MKHPALWGHLKERYQQERPRKLLALDGGGIRGLITLGILERIEALLATASGRGKNFRLHEHFDYIAGTSTGAIIAAGLARGMSVAELVRFYSDNGKAMFEPAFLLERLKYFYTADPLKLQLQKAFGENTNLLPEHLKCLLLVVTKNNSTDSPWPISSNPEARYNRTTRNDCNLCIPLWQLVRASTAAPVYFPPEELNWDREDPAKKFIFVDGGVTPYNNPAFLLYRMATEEPYALQWSTGERNLLLISVGTGGAPTISTNIDQLIPEAVLGALSHVMSSAQIDQDINCRMIGRCTHGSLLDRELLDLIPRIGPDDGSVEERLARPRVPLDRDLGRRFLYARYDADLTKSGLAKLGFKLDPRPLLKMENATMDNMDNLLAVGREAGKQVSLDHFGS